MTATTIVPPATETVAPQQVSPPSAKRHLYQIDAVRVITFCAVVLTHTNSGINSVNSPLVGAVTMSLHFTRDAFMFLTALVLVHRYRQRAPRTLPFWRKRIVLVAVPYLGWTALYTWLNNKDLSAVDQLRTLAVNVITGGACYHIYFLLVTIQFYLVFPLFLAVMRWARRRPLTVLAVSAAVQLAVAVAELYLPAVEGGPLWSAESALIVSYQFYFVLGGVVAVHLGAVTDWVRAHSGGLITGCLLVLLGSVATYVLMLRLGIGAYPASWPLRPTLIPWNVAAIALLYAIGVRWTARSRTGDRTSRLLAAGSERSFGVFLVHPLVLYVVIAAALPTLQSHLNPVATTFTAYLLTLGLSLALVEVLHWLPGSRYLIGRARRVPSWLPAAVGGQSRAA